MIKKNKITQSVDKNFKNKVLNVIVVTRLALMVQRLVKHMLVMQHVLIIQIKFVVETLPIQFT